MARKGGLGKGLNALFMESDLNTDAAYGEKLEQAVILNVSSIEPNKNQPRYCFDEDAILALSESIKANGLLQPIVVRKINNEKFEIVAGERRFRALKLAGLTKIPAIVRKINQQGSTELALIENLQRENLNSIEEAKSFLMLIKVYKLTQEEVAKKVGRSRSAIANSIRLLNLPDEILRYVESSKLSEGQARALLTVHDENLMKKFAKKAVEQKLSVRELEKLCALSRKVKKKKNKKQQHELYNDLEKSLQATIKRNVKIELLSGEKGRLVVEFYNRDDLISMANALSSFKS